MQTRLPPTAQCLTPEAMARFLSDDTADSSSGAALDAHLAGCSHCRQVIEELIGELPDSFLPHRTDDPLADAVPPDLPGFDVLERIDAGGMGVIWRARELAFGRALAVKVMKAATGNNPHAVRRFLSEARIAGRLAHPFIVPVHACGALPDGRPYFTMKLIDGETLAARLRADRTPDGRAALVRVFAQVCQAVAHAHGCGVIHRDLKPANVMVGAFGEVQVMDWGLAKEVAACVTPSSEVPARPDAPTLGAIDRTQTGAVLGTLPYLAPEQARGEIDGLDARCDVFSLGAILCEILTGYPPHRSGVADEVLRRAACGELADAFARLDGCGAAPELLELAKACLEPDRDRRPPDAGAVAARVLAYEAGAEQRLRQAEIGRAEAQAEARGARGRARLAYGLVAAVLLGGIGLTLAVVLVNHARERAGAAKDVAEARRQRAASVLDLMTSTLAGESLEAQPDITAEQKAFLAAALDYYREIAEEEADDEHGRKRVAGVAYRLGLINHRLGFQDAAVRATEQARDRYQSLARDFRAEPEYRRHLAHCHTNLGLLLRERGKRTEALEEIRRALDLRRQLVAENAAPDYRHDLANGCHNIGLLHDDLGDRPAALSAHREALSIREKLDAEFPGKQAYQRNLAGSRTTLGTLFQATGHHTEAEAAFRAAIEVQEKLRVEFPEKLQDDRHLAVSYVNLGALLHKSSRRPDAERAYRNALDISQQLADRFATVPRYRRDLASVYTNLGIVLLERGKRPEAEDALRRAVAVREKLAADSPAPEHRRELANSYNNLGSLLKRSDPAAAEKVYRTVLELRAALAAEVRDVPEYRRELGSAHNNLGAFLRDQKKPADAEKEHCEAVTIRERLVAQFPGTANYEHDLANTFNNLGLALRDQKKRDEAEGAFRKALALQEQLFAKHRRVPEYGQDAAMSHFNLGQLHYEWDDPEAAETAFRNALARWERLEGDFPELTENSGKHGTTLSNLATVRCQRGAPEEALELFDKAIPYLKLQAADRHRLGTARRGRAKALVLLKRFDDAVAEWDRMVELSSGQENAADRADRAYALVRAGTVARALSEAEELAKSTTASAATLHTLSRVYARAAESDGANREAHLRTALLLLRRAVDGGFRGLLAEDADLKALRNLTEFHELARPLSPKTPARGGKE